MTDNGNVYVYITPELRSIVTELRGSSGNLSEEERILLDALQDKDRISVDELKRIHRHLRQFHRSDDLLCRSLKGTKVLAAKKEPKVRTSFNSLVKSF